MPKTSQLKQGGISCEGDNKDMEGVVKLLLILQNQQSRNTTIVSYVVKLKVPQKNPPQEAWSEVLYGIFQARQLQNRSVRNSAAHASLEEHGRQVVTLPSWYPQRSVIQCITNKSALSLLEWLELCMRCQKRHFVHTTECEHHQILNEAELSITKSKKRMSSP